MLPALKKRRTWTGVDHKIFGQRRSLREMDSPRVLVGDKALRFASPPHSGADGLDADSARARVANIANARHTSSGTGELAGRDFYAFR